MDAAMNLNEILLLNKHVGETPLACIERFRLENPTYQGMSTQVKMTYAGRLDPIAEGLLVVLTGDKVHEKEKYNQLDKVYECTALIGVSTDTYDVLGVPQVIDFDLREHFDLSGLDAKSLVDALNSFVGTFQQAYPPYSSKTVDGRALHEIARSGEINNVVIPSRGIKVYEANVTEVKKVSVPDVLNTVIEIVQQVSGDFRQREILDAWQVLLSSAQKKGVEHLVTVSLRIRVSSGTYIRGIVNSLGEKLGTGACIMRLKRVSVGELKLSDAK